jgi:hypothetical protein
MVAEMKDGRKWGRREEERKGMGGGRRVGDSYDTIT